MHITQAMETYLMNAQTELRQLIRDLCTIPAPSHHEEKRAAFIRDWFETAGAQDVRIDEALNVICPVGVTADNAVDVFMAHTDTVFPDTEPLPFRETEDKFYAPGVSDDTANLAVLMICARWFIQNPVASERGMLFIANSCEEGLGNLKGSRAVCDAYASRIRRFVSFDGTYLGGVLMEAVGSHRYRIAVSTEGGHSYSAFGNRNAIRYLASMIDALYAVKVPEKENTRTTYNVGTISGGTSVNTIAQYAEMLYEYRSNDLECLQIMQRMLAQIAESYRCMGVGVDVELVGERPCACAVDPEAHGSLIALCDAAIREIAGLTPAHGIGSTDANIPLSRGIPAVTVAACSGRYCHTREEELELSSLPVGCRLAMEIIAACAD